MFVPIPLYIYTCVFKYMYVHIYIYIYIYMNVWKYECMNACMYVRSKLNGVPYHLWAKMLHPEDPPPHLLEAQKTCGGGYISCGQVKYFSEISCLTPPKYSRVKGGGMFNINHHESVQLIPADCLANCPESWRFLLSTVFRSTFTLPLQLYIGCKASLCIFFA